MFFRMLIGGLIAGALTGVLAAALHFAFLQDLILQSELYEAGTLVHFSETGWTAEEEEAHAHGAMDSESALTRNALTVLFAGLVYAGYGLVLAAAYQVARGMGYQITLMHGVLWGLAGFAIVQMAPSLGLPPNLPGTVAPDITERQIWWFATMGATAAGLALIVLRQTLPMLAIGVVIMAVPHVIGAPEIDTYYGLAPPEIAAKFATGVLGVGLIAWVTLGLLVSRLTRPAD